MSLDGHTKRAAPGEKSASSAQTGPRRKRPNVVVILLDDVGFGQLSCFGSSIDTPNIDRLAGEGLRYRDFHTTALCSPTRAALLTGRNPHSVGFGHIAERASEHPGYSARIPESAATVAEILRDEGYSTRALGKWHLMPTYEAGPAGPFDRWPLGKGFERFYGFLGGSTDQYVPELYRDNSPTEPPAAPEDGYHLTTDLIDEAIEQIRSTNGVSPEKPYFLYLAPGACHAPHQAPAEFIEPYRGKFDHGWDEERKQTLERQREIGVVLEGTELPPSNPGVQQWEALSADEKALYARMMEVYAGFLSHTDHEIGRLLDFIRETDEYDNTLIIFLSDNGASAEGGPHGSVDEGLYFNDMPQRLEDAYANAAKLGGPALYNHYPWGWAQAGNTPFRWYKQFTHAGGITNGCIVSMPELITTPGSVRSQYHHVIDVASTILEVTQVEPPKSIRGVEQQALHGTSMVYSFNDPNAPTRRPRQHYEIWGNRGIRQDGWMAIARHQPDAPAAWPPGAPPAALDDKAWELYDHLADPAENTDLAQSQPARLREMVQHWWDAARQYDVLPVDTRARGKRWNPQLDPMGAIPGRASFRGKSGPYERGVVPRVAGRSFRLEAEVSMADALAEGVLYSLGSRHGGYSWYILRGEMVFEVNLMSVDRHRVAAPIRQVDGRRTLAVDVVADDDLSGEVGLYIDNDLVHRGSVGRLLKIAPIGGGRTHIGFDPPSAVSDQYESPFEFQGKIHRLDIISLGPEVATALPDDLARQ